MPEAGRRRAARGRRRRRAVPRRRHLARRRQLRHRLAACYAGEAAAEALAARRRQRRRPGRLPPPARGRRSCCSDHRKLRRVPELVLVDRVQHQYPALIVQRRRADVPRRQPDAEAGAAPHRRATSCSAAGVRLRDLARDALDGGQELRMSDELRMSGARPLAGRASWPRSASRTAWPRSSSACHPSAHIIVDGDACRGCTDPRRASSPARPTCSCPTSDGGILFNYEQCFECGTCYLVCNTEGAITWTYPEGGHGVVFQRTLSAARCCSIGVVPEVGRPPARGRPAHRRGRTTTPAPPARPTPTSAALEWALRAAEAWDGEVVAVTRRPARGRRACCARRWPPARRRAVRVDLAGRRAPATTSPRPWRQRSPAAALVWCGDALASTGAAARCPPSSPPTSAPRRRSAWWRSSPARRRRARWWPRAGSTAAGASGCASRPPAVLSVEGACRPAAAGHDRRRAAGPHRHDRRAGPAPPPTSTSPTRPARSAPEPAPAPRPSGASARERILALTDALTTPSATAAVELTPAEAADRILEALEAWGYLERP